MIGRRREPAMFRQIADEIAGRITVGELAPGDPVPSADLICRTYGVGMATANRVLDVLKEQGLIDTFRGRPSRVRELAVRETGWLDPGATVTARWPTPAEVRDETLALADGVPVLVVQQVGEPDVVYPADRWQLTVPRSAPAKGRQADKVDPVE